MLIRSVKAQDAEKILPLMEQLGYPQTLETMKEILLICNNTSYYFTLVSEDAHKIIGIINIAIYKNFLSPGKMAHIQALIVDKDYRGQGIGKDLMQTAEKHAQQQGCVALELTSGIRRAPEGTHEFYKKLGYLNEGPMAKLYLRKKL